MKIIPLTAEYIVNNWPAIESLEKSSGLTPTWNKDNFINELPKKWLLSRALIIDGNLTGYIVVSEKSAHCIHIHRLVIAPLLQKHGFGTELMQDVINTEKQKYDFISLKSWSDAAKTFYQKFDFSILWDNEEHPLMLKLLKK